MIEETNEVRRTIAMVKKVLVCTVGGSHQPIVTAIKEARPEFVVFLCTDKDPTTRQSGSRVQIKGEGSVIKAQPQDPAPNLPNIPSQCELEETQYETEIVSADNLDQVVDCALKVFEQARARFPEATILADYTGGTKTMTAGLAIAALECSYVELRLVTGARGDLERVHDGSQRSVVASAEAVRLRRAMAPLLGAWKRFGYAEAALGLEAIAAPANETLRSELTIAAELSKALDAWDRFDHSEAHRILTPYGQRIGKHWHQHLTFLKVLAHPEGNKEVRQEPARLWDLWRNAERRAAQGRYDDAVARGYRLLEWTAQWLLRTRAEIDTANVPEDKIPAGLKIAPNRHGKRQAGLYASWELVRNEVKDGPGRFAENARTRLLDHLQARNESILAHGFRPVTAEGWSGFRGFIEQDFLPMLREQTDFNKDPKNKDPKQLPTEAIWEDVSG